MNVTPTTPTTAPNTVTTLEDTAYTFTAANFPLTGPAGETLQSVTVVTLPALGTALEVQRRQRHHGGPDEITAANIANLTFTPVNGGTNGSPYTTFPLPGHRRAGGDAVPPPPRR